MMVILRARDGVLDLAGARSCVLVRRLGGYVVRYGAGIHRIDMPPEHRHRGVCWMVVLPASFRRDFKCIFLHEYHTTWHFFRDLALLDKNIVSWMCSPHVLNTVQSLLNIVQILRATPSSLSEVFMRSSSTH